MNEEYRIRISDDGISITRQKNIDHGNSVYYLGTVEPSQWDFALAKGLATIFREVTQTQEKEFQSHYRLLK